MYKMKSFSGSNQTIWWREGCSNRLFLVCIRMRAPPFCWGSIDIRVTRCGSGWQGGGSRVRRFFFCYFLSPLNFFQTRLFLGDGRVWKFFVNRRCLEGFFFIGSVWLVDFLIKFLVYFIDNKIMESHKDGFIYSNKEFNLEKTAWHMYIQSL